MLVGHTRLNDVTGAILAAAIEVHRVLGPGLLESSYHVCLCPELELREIAYHSQKNDLHAATQSVLRSSDELQR